MFFIFNQEYQEAHVSIHLAFSLSRCCAAKASNSEQHTEHFQRLRGTNTAALAQWAHMAPMVGCLVSV